MRDNISPENISGFVVGEGCFYVESGKDPKYKLGYRVRAAFCIELREDDREILESIREALGCGNIYSLDFGRYEGYSEKGWRPHVKYRVSNQVDLTQKVIPFFRKYPLFGKKLQSFELFTKIVGKLEAKEHLTINGLEETMALVSALKALNKKGV
jgi:hypothetical protein